MSSETSMAISAFGAFDAARLDNAQLNGSFSAIEQEEVKQLLSEAMRKLNDLGGQLSLDATEDQATSAQRNEQISLIMRFRIVLAPYKKLPAEILAGIFLACAEGSRDRRYTYAHVCHTWRQIALSTPRLWNRIWVDYLYCEKVLERTMMVNEMISRSGGLPIDLACSVGPRVSRGSATYEADIFDIVTSISARSSSLLLDLPAECSIVPKLFRLPPGLFNRLETLKIHAGSIWKLKTEGGGHVEATESEDSSKASGIVVFSNAPSLHSIELFSPFPLAGTMPMFHAPWAELTSLTLLVRVPINLAHTILAQCNLLELCEIMIVDTPQSEINGFPAHLDDIFLRNLQRLAVMTQLVEGDCAIFMKPFILPALLSLTFSRWVPTAEWAQFQSVASLLDRSGCSLRSFSTSFELVDEHIKPLLEKMPMLARLKLTFDPTQSGTWPLPTCISSTTLQLMSCGKLVPKLRSLECPVGYPDLFVDMLERRQLWYTDQHPEDKDGGIRKFHGKCIYYNQDLKSADKRLLELTRSGPGRSYRLSSSSDRAYLS